MVRFALLCVKAHSAIQSEIIEALASNHRKRCKIPAFTITRGSLH
jgi:hypothetical protein